MPGHEHEHEHNDGHEHQHEHEGDAPGGLTAPIDRLSRMKRLDGIAGAVAGLTERSSGLATRLLRGEPLGHPLHPVLTDLPIGFWTSAALLDLRGGRRRAARTLVGAGVLSTLPTMLTGLVDVPQLSPTKRRVAVVHAATNLVATAGYLGSWWMRHRSGGQRGVALGMVSGLTASVGGALGGWLAFAPEAGPNDLAGRLATHLGDVRVATAESCTAGRVATALAGVDDASTILAGSVVAYADRTKRDVLGVTAPSMYSEEAALEMALGACKVFGVDVAVSTSGVVGESPQDGVPVGTVFIGTAVHGAARAARYDFDGSPDEIVNQARDQALRDLDGVLTGAIQITEGQTARVSPNPSHN